MNSRASNPGVPAVEADTAPGLLVLGDRAEFQAAVDRLRTRDKAHTGESDAIAAARRRLPIVEVDAPGLVPALGQPRPRPLADQRAAHRPVVRTRGGAATTTTSVPGRRSAAALATEPAVRGGITMNFLDRRFPLTDMPVWLMLVLVALGLPRTILADLDIVAPENSLLYYVLALTPFAAWLVVAIVRSSRRPFADFLVLDVLYGLSLVVVHQVLWDVGPSLGHNPPESAVDFANQFSPAWRELTTRAYSSGIAMVIGVGTGLAAALVAVGVHAWRKRRARRAAPLERTPR